VYDVSGALVRVLARGPRSEGTFEATWDGRDADGAEVASGVYFYRLVAGSFSQTRKMVLMK
jgi:flagellar hook assembly protein FlgD